MYKSFLENLHFLMFKEYLESTDKIRLRDDRTFH